MRVDGGKPKGEPQLIKPDIGRIDPMGVIEDRSFYFYVSKRLFDVYVAKIDPSTGKILESPVKATQRFEGSNISAAWSPDGKYFAYVSNRGPLWRNRTLLVWDMETGKERELRPQLSAYSYPRWSPDGRRILLQSGLGYYEIDIETEKVTPLILGKIKTDIETPQYSPDGKSIYYVLGNGTKDPRKIKVRNLKSGDEKELYSVPEDDIYIVLSKDGQRLAILNRAKDRSLKVMPSSGGEPQEIYKFEQERDFVTSMAWTADGRHILFTMKKPNTGNLWELFRIPATGGEPQNLGIAMANIGHLSVHPDGQHILFWSRGFQDLRETPGELWVMENFLPKEKSPAPSKSH
jgi:Tol biopolymer transport system component